MRKIILILLFFLNIIFTDKTISQVRDIEDKNNINLGLGISTVYEISRIVNSNANFIGFKISLISKTNEIGFSLQKLDPKSNKNIIKIQFDPETVTYLSFDIFNGDIFYNKYINIYNNVYICLGLSLGVAFTTLNDKGNNHPYFFQESFSSDSYIYSKPNIGIGYNVWSNLFLHFDVGYRFIDELNMDSKMHPEIINISNNGFSKFFLSFSIKYIFVLR